MEMTVKPAEQSKEQTPSSGGFFFFFYDCPDPVISTAERYVI